MIRQPTSPAANKNNLSEVVSVFMLCCYDLIRYRQIPGTFVAGWQPLNLAGKTGSLCSSV